MTNETFMQAIALTGNPEIDKAFQTITLPRPEVQPFDVLVKIAAIAVNPFDIKMRHQAAAGTILGWDTVGTIVAMGKQAQQFGFQVGDRVFYSGDISRPGCYAQYQAVDVQLIAKAPQELTIEECAAVPLTALTAWEGLFDLLKLSTKKETLPKPTTLLVINGAGGVGSMIIQLVKKLTNIQVIATASQELSRHWCQDLGADLVVNHYDLLNSLAANGISNVDYIYNCYDLSMHWHAMMQLIRPFGHIVTIAEANHPITIEKLPNKAMTVSWEVMLAKNAEYYHFAEHGKILRKIANLLNDKVIYTNLHQIIGTLNLENIRQAHQLIEAGHVMGKLVLTVDDALV